MICSLVELRGKIRVLTGISDLQLNENRTFFNVNDLVPMTDNIIVTLTALQSFYL